MKPIHPLVWALPLSAAAATAIAVSVGTTPLRLTLQIVSFLVGTVAAYFVVAPTKQIVPTIVDDALSRGLLLFLFPAMTYLIVVLVIYLPLAAIAGV